MLDGQVLYGVGSHHDPGYGDLLGEHEDRVRRGGGGLRLSVEGSVGLELVEELAGGVEMLACSHDVSSLGRVGLGARREELRAVLTAVTQLPEDQRAALVLAELGDISHDEIAQILDCRREQVKSYVYQARATLMTDRVARETPCSDIRRQLSEMRGGQLRRAPLRRHLRDCDGCREFREALRAQRKQLGLLLPVTPSLGLKRAVIGAVLGGGGATGGLSVGGVAATAVLVVAIPAGTAAVASGAGEPARRAPTVSTSAAITASSPAAAPASVDRRRPRGSEPSTTERAAPTAPRRDARPTGDSSPSHSPRRTARDTTQPTPRASAPAAELPAKVPARSQPDESKATAGPGQKPPAKPKPTPGKPKTPGKPANPPGKPSGPPPGQSKRESAPGRAIAQNAPARSNNPNAASGRPATPPGQDHQSKPTPPAPSIPEHAAALNPPASPPAEPPGRGPEPRAGQAPQGPPEQANAYGNGPGKPGDAGNG